MNGGIQVFFYVLVCLFFILKRTELKQIKIRIADQKFRRVGQAILIGCALLLVRVLCAPDDAWSKIALLTLFLCGWTTVPRLGNWPAYARQIWLLYWTVLCTTTFNHDLPVIALCSILLGLLVCKLWANFLLGAEDSLEDILPSCVWLSILAWASLTGRPEASVGNPLLACLSISLVLKWLPAALLANDKYFVRRVVLSVCAGLALSLVLNSVLLQPKLMLLAVLFAAGTLSSYVFQNESNGADWEILLQSTTFLVSLGILTLIATRLIGDIGLVVLCAAACINVGKGMFASSFWICRLLIQGFVMSNVANVTGINLMHPYCTAALFLGFLTILFLSVILHISTRLPAALLAYLLMGLTVPPAILYLIHEEPAASFLIATNVVAISLVSFVPLIYKELTTTSQSSLMLMPWLLSTVALLFAPLIEIGNHATVSTRFQIVAYAGVAFLVIYGVLIYRNRASRQSIAVSGD